MPNDFISREALDELMSTIELPEERYRGDESNRDMFFMGINDAWEAIDRLPAADVVEVVRCKDCRFYAIKQSSLCDMHNTAVNAEDYCSYGVKNDGGKPNAR